MIQNANFKFKLKLLVLALASGTYTLPVYADSSPQNNELSSRVNQALTRSKEQANTWFNGLKTDVIQHNPANDTVLAELDRQGSLKQQAIIGNRKALAEEDASQDHQHRFDLFATATLGNKDEAGEIAYFPKTANTEYKQLYDIVHDAQYSVDKKNKSRRADSIFKKLYKRGRPYQVLDKNREYKAGYQKIEGTSFPSGHTWDGFREATVWSMIFPERGDEIFSRALQYGESRTILGKHFPTDTIGSRVGNYYYLAKILDDDATVETIVELAKQNRGKSVVNCPDGQSLQFCLWQKPKPLTDMYAKNNDEIGYYGLITDKSASATLNANELPAKSANLLRLRYPYLTDQQRLETLASTAYAKNSIADKVANQHWGLINLPKAYHGTTRLDSDWTVQQDYQKNQDISGFGQYDEWHNNITGTGQLIKQGKGTLKLSGNNEFKALQLNEGSLILTGNNHLSSPNSIVNQGILTLAEKAQFNSDLLVNGGKLDITNNAKVNANVTVQNQGILSGTGFAKNVTVKQGGAISPANTQKIGTLQADNITFEAGSIYQANVNQTGNSDNIHAKNNITIQDNAILALHSEETGDLLTEPQSKNLLGKTITVLSSTQPIQGKFNILKPRYPFLTLDGDYSHNKLAISFKRNEQKVDAITNNPNEKEIAKAIDNKGSSNLYDAVINAKDTEQAKKLLALSNGQFYSTTIASQVQDQQNIGQLLSQHLQHNPQKMVWGSYVYQNTHQAETDGIKGYDSYSNGFMIGSDIWGNDKTNIGGAFAYSKSNVAGDYGESKGNNWHAMVYGEHNLENTLHNAKIYGTLIHSLYDNKIKRFSNENQLKANATQIMTGIDVPINDSFSLFADATMINHRQDAISEGNQLTQLKLPQHNSTHIFATIGMDTQRQWDINHHTYKIGGSIAWQQKLGGNYDVLAYLNDAKASFTQRSAKNNKSQAILDIYTSWALGNQHTLGLAYQGRFAKDNQQNSTSIQYQYKF